MDLPHFSQVSQQNLHDAVHSLVSRLAYLKLHFGEKHKRTIKAQVTLSRAYLDLSQHPEQAHDHALAAREIYLNAMQSHDLPNNLLETQQLDTDTR